MTGQKDYNIVGVSMTNSGISVSLIVSGSDLLCKSGINCCETNQIFS